MNLPPVAARKPTRRIHHNDVFVDNYEWMRDKDAPEVIAHLTAENAYTDSRTSHLELLQEQIFEEIKDRTQETDLSVPVRRGQWWHYTRSVEGQEYGIHCRAPISGPDDWTPPVIEPATGTDATGTDSTGAHTGDAAPGLPGEQVLLDDNAEAAGHDFYSLGSFDVSDDGSTLLYAVDIEGDERYTVRIRTIATGENLADEIPNTSAGALFDPSGRYVFYTTVDDAWRPDTVWRHEVGTSVEADVTVFTEPDERFWVGVGRSRSNRYLMIEAGSSVTSETFLLDAADPTGEFTVVWPRRDNVEYDVEHAVIDGEDRLLIVHNHNAVNFELVSVPAADPKDPGRVVLPHSERIRLESVDAFRDFVVVEYRKDGLTRVAYATKRGGGLTEITFDEELFSVGTGGNPEWNQPTIRLGYTSFVTPSTVYDYVVATGELRLLKQQPVLGHYDPTLFEQRREWAVAADGTRVPISIVYRSDLVEPGVPAPTLLYGYGSYEISIDPSFSISRLSLLDRGMIFAVAHVRGGGELGRLWYENGKTHQKRNSFTDFVACAEHLIDCGYTSPDKLVAEGRSAGGLLMGAVANMAPSLFSGILAGVPFVDPLTSILDPSLPLTVIEWDEWGDPLHDAEVYAYMKTYSPLENVHQTHYPRILAVTSLNDTRVLYVEPAKWVARLREVGADALLKTEMSAGHGGVSGRYAGWRERAFDYAWLIDAAGAHPSGEGEFASLSGADGGTA
ncbi:MULTISPECIES: S9 family peptidase [unclassified Cryobacterium]|uniref:S9 family peptidase n=1 Tax=unclassified Cryobacterium TaxID=2649013 RepID=UPI00106D60FB|nr:MULTISPECIES: S9 family peptidase [unclassified Cryobacterium]TFC50421.1 S9 family peptidase [Cryobacterium sp. TMB3-1-2]TFC60749.1 S9 family peptidase [Cryobacterium sp. TMB1-7]TFC71844.1 S9 family peptidase [Cryobacterium sp. TMB3-15]TFC78437.1 S9 family peptidase [Cryobacterium sp. TMB3-10]TFD44494.1 S9 family peptidase [Cryobacterium sp. TMB3-12]